MLSVKEMSRVDFYQYPTGKNRGSDKKQVFVWS